ncbi:MAG: GNAT family N-acetyltransferase [Anaerolineaceae bacterium]|nr:GNAT family N-acetyltransferase [Anaerolineaceae bacterium]
MYKTFDELKKDYQIRPARMDDAQEVADLFNRCSQEIIQKDEFEAGELTAGWESESLEMEKDTIMVRDHDTLIAYGDVWGVLPPYVRVNTWVRVHPAYKNRGIGWVLNQWTEARAREFTQKADKHLQTFTVNYMNINDHASIQLLTDLGAKPVRYSFVMEGELPEEISVPVLPEKITIRKIDPAEYKKVYYLKEEAFEDHWGHIGTTVEEGIKEFESEHLQDPNYDPDLWFAAEANGEMIGMIFGSKSTPFGPDYGWVSILGVKREWRHRRIGKALMLHFFQIIKEKGSHKVGLSVDSDSLTGATQLYESVGLRVIEQYVRMEKILKDGIDLRVRDLEPSKHDTSNQNGL